EAIEDANELDYNAQQRSFTEFQGISPDLSPEELEELGIDPNSTARPDYTGLPMPLSRVLQGAANVADTVHARQGTEVVQQVDPIASMRARMREMFANEIALGKKQESMQQIGRVLQSSLTGLERYVGGG
ncbi:MAG: hypothetical protein GWN97_22480, partial [Thermoplasmata archaeon]|nr:hypothetical protein [Thermoplasmata archaeon]NIT80339.1 hypothetical protein [Thermoplasmata archaeon]NIY06707.1 hypothetical protein [Thermoplasmata archaeon]